MSSLFRSAKALRVTRALAACSDNANQGSKSLIEAFYKVAEKESRYTVVLHENTEVELSKLPPLKAFILSKPFLSDKALDNLNQFITTNVNNNDIKQNITQELEIEVECEETVSPLVELPQDIFSTIGSYLPLKSSINLSLTNSEIFLMIHNDDYFGYSRKQTNELILYPSLGETILTTNANMECFKKCQRLIISSINPYDDRDNGAASVYIYNFLSKIQCSDTKRCFFCKLVKEIKDLGNYDLYWFKILLSTVSEIFWSIKWACIFNENHIPISWIFDKQKVKKSGASKSVKISGHGYSKSLTHEKSTTLSTTQMFSFVNAYDAYFNKKLAEIDNHEQKDGGNGNNIGKGDNTNGDSKTAYAITMTKQEKMNIVYQNTRKFKDMRMDLNKYDLNTIAKLHGNFGELTFQLPPPRYTTRLFESLDQFYQVFHRQLSKLRIHCQPVKNDDPNVVSQLFGLNTNDNNGYAKSIVYINDNDNDAVTVGSDIKKDDDNGNMITTSEDANLDVDTLNVDKTKERIVSVDNLIKDLGTSQDKLSFEQFLQKYKIDISSVGPRIRHLTFSFSSRYASNANNGGANIDKKGIISFIKHDKLIKLFCIEKSVTHLDFGLRVASNITQIKTIFSDMMKIIEIICKKMQRLKIVIIRLQPEQSCNWQNLAVLYDLHLDKILYNCCLATNIIRVTITIKHGFNIYRNRNIHKWNIALDSTDLLLPRNALKLRQIIQHQTSKSRNTLETEWNDMESDIKSGKFLFRHAFMFNKNFRV